MFRNVQIIAAACVLAISCSRDEPSKDDGGPTSAGDMGDVSVDATGVAVDDSGEPVGDDTDIDADTETVDEFDAPTFGGLGTPPIRVEHLTPYPGGGWAVLGTPTSGAMIDGEPLTGTFAVGVVDGSGELVWAKTISPPDRDSELGSVAADGDGNVYVGLVSFSRTIDFGDGVTENGDSEGRAQSGFVVKYDSAGTTQWATGFWADSGLANTFVAARGEHVVAAGTYTIWDPLSFRGNDGIVRIGPEFKRGATRTAFVIPLDPDTGWGEWFELYSSSSDGTTLSDVEVLEDGAILTAGYFDGLDGGAVTDPADNILTEDAPGGYVARFESTGALGFFTVVGQRLQVATDGSSVAIAGTYGEGIDFGDGAQGGPGAFVASVQPVSGDLTGHVVLSGMSGVTALTDDEAGVHALVAPPREGDTAGELDGIALPTDESFAVSFDDSWSVSWLTTFPGGEATNVTANDIAATSGTVGIGGNFVGDYDFGGGTVTAAAPEGFLVQY